MRLPDCVGRRLAAVCALALLAVAATGPKATADPLSSYASTVISDGATDYWRLNEDTGTTFADSADGGIDGVWHGSPELGFTGVLVCEPTYGVNFAETSGAYGSVSGVTIPESRMSVEAWFFKLRGSEGGTILGKSIGGSDHTVTLSIDSGDLLTADFYGPSSAHDSVVSPYNVASGWHHAVATFEGGAARLYLDGELVDSDVFAFETLAQNSADFEIGGQSGGPEFDGAIDEVAVYAAPLSDAQVADHYAQARSVAEGQELGCESSALLATGTVADGASHVTAYAFPDQATVEDLTANDEDIELTPVAEADVEDDDSFVMRTDDLANAGVDGSGDGFVNMTLITDGGDGSSYGFSDAVDGDNVPTGPAAQIEVPEPEEEPSARSEGRGAGSRAAVICSYISKPVGSDSVRQARIGETWSGSSPLTAKFTYQVNAVTEYGVGVSASGSYGSFHASGTVRLSNSTNASFSTTGSSTNRAYFKGVRYHHYEIQRVGCGPTTTISHEWRPVGDTGGFTQSSAGAWTAYYCADQPSGMVWTRAKGRLSAFSSGLEISSVIGIDLSVSTTAEYNAAYTYNFVGHRGSMCGDNGYPSTANKIKSVYF